MSNGNKHKDGDPADFSESAPCKSIPDAGRDNRTMIQRLEPAPKGPAKRGTIPDKASDQGDQKQ